MSKYNYSFKITQHFSRTVRMTTAGGFDTAKSQGFSVEIGVADKVDGQDYLYGYWEICSDDSNCYGEGSLHFHLDKKCFDYDGCFSLASEVCDLLERAGYDMTEVR